MIDLDGIQKRFETRPPVGTRLFGWTPPGHRDVFALVGTVRRLKTLVTEMQHHCPIEIQNEIEVRLRMMGL